MGRIVDPAQAQGQASRRRWPERGGRAARTREWEAGTTIFPGNDFPFLALPLGPAPWRCPLALPLCLTPCLTPACLFACLSACLRLCGGLWVAALGCGGLCCGFGLRLWLWLWAVALGCGGLCCCQRPSPLPPPGVLDTTTFLFFSFSSPECGATLWYRYLMPHVAFSVAVVAK